MRNFICLCLAWLSVLQVGFVREVASAADAPQPETLLPAKFKEQAAAEQSVQKDADASVERVPRQSSIQNTNILIDNDRRGGGRGGGGGGCRHGGCHHGGGCRHGGCGGHCRHRDCHRGGGFGPFGGFGIGGGIFGGK